MKLTDSIPIHRKPPNPLLIMGLILNRFDGVVFNSVGFNSVKPLRNIKFMRCRGIIILCPFFCYPLLIGVATALAKRDRTIINHELSRHYHH